MAEPFLDLRNVGTVFEGIASCGGPETLGAKCIESDTDGFCVSATFRNPRNLAGLKTRQDVGRR